MITDKIVVSSKGNQMESALRQAEKVAAYKELGEKQTMHLRLLTEEMMGMMRSITGEPRGVFWIEDDGDDTYQLHLKVDTRMDSEKRDQLLAASTSGKNESAKGFMGRLRDFFDRSGDADVVTYSNPLFMSGAMEYSSTPALDWEWSMSKYETELASRIQEDESAREAWDELEKSVVHNIADEVKVSIKGQSAEMIIFKKLG